MTPDFPQIKFNGILRPSQKEVVKIAQRKLEEGRRRLHIVAPPGSGKTVLGLYLWAECISVPALVLSPNSAIQAQWAARTDLFRIGDPAADLNDPKLNNTKLIEFGNHVSTNPDEPALLNSLTYQSVTLPRRGDEDLDELALMIWREKLIEENQAETLNEATHWIEDLKLKNRDYYESRLSLYRKKIRDQQSLQGNSLDVLHDSSRQTLENLSAAGVGLVILDECHHLMGHWGRVLADARELFTDPIVIGLTATPPDRDGKHSLDIERYDEFFGGIDYEVPVPAVVKDGFLAPYQDLAYFVRPTAAELEFVATTDEQFHQLVDQFCQNKPFEQGIPGENESESSEKQRDRENEPADIVKGIDGIIEDDSDHGLDSEAISEPAEPGESSAVDSDSSDASETVIVRPDGAAASLPFWLYDVLEHRRIANTNVKDWSGFERRDSAFADVARRFIQLRQWPLPYGVPELDISAHEPELSMDEWVIILDRYIRHGLRRSALAADRTEADSAISKLRMLGIQVTETGSRACASPVGRVLAYSRNKIAALPEILECERRSLGDKIRAVVVTDFEKSSATHADVGDLLNEESGGAVAAFRQLVSHPETDPLNPILLTGSSVLVDDDVVEPFMEHARQWLSQSGFDVQLSAEGHEQFRVVEGSGSDWCPRVYVEMITEMFQQGISKCLVGTRGLLGEGWDANRINVLIDLTTVTTSMTVNQLRGRSIRLDPLDPAKVANNWDVICIAPEFTKGLDDYRRFEAKHKTLYGVTDDGAIEKGVGHVHAAFTELKPEGIEGSTQVLNADMLRRVEQRMMAKSLWKIGKPYQNRPIRSVETRIEVPATDFPPFRGENDPWNEKSLTMAISNAILYALVEAGLIKRNTDLHVGERDGGYLRLFLENASSADNEIFVQALAETLGPLSDPRYIIPRVVSRKVDSWLSKLLPQIVGRFFQKEKKVRVMFHAVPSILARHRSKVQIFEKGWNSFVSPGQAVFTHRGAGEEMLSKAKNSRRKNRSEIHQKEIFL